jgi:hypothetical protein
MFRDAARLTSYPHIVKQAVTLNERHYVTHASSFSKQNAIYTSNYQATHFDPEDGGNITHYHMVSYHQ